MPSFGNMSKTLLTKTTYKPDNLLDELMKRVELKNDAALARFLQVSPPVISKVRHRRLPIGAMLLIRMHETSGVSIRELRSLMGDNDPFFGAV